MLKIAVVGDSAGKRLPLWASAWMKWGNAVIDVDQMNVKADG